jgi:hypothetical protein
MSGVATAAAVRITVAELPADTKRVSVGRLDSAGREPVGVEVDERSLIVAGAEQEGTYAGQIDVNGSVAGGTSELTLKARDAWVAPLIVLLSGIAVGFVIEWWLTRWRPRALLDRRLGRQIGRIERRRERVDETLLQLFKQSRPEGLHIPADRAGGSPAQRALLPRRGPRSTSAAPVSSSRSICAARAPTQSANYPVPTGTSSRRC